MSVADLVAVVIAAAAGYAIGSLPVSMWVARAGGAEVHRDGERDPGPADVWRGAGPGWGFLAVVADLARGVLPVTLAAATFSWGAGWAAGLGALAGAAWPALGRVRGGPGAGVLPVVLAGVVMALEPAALIAAGALWLVALGIRRILGRSAERGR